MAHTARLWTPLAALLLTLGCSMGTKTIFSEVRGRVTENGAPVGNASIDRSFRWVWKNEAGSDRTTTDANGNFTLPAIRRSSFLGSLVPHEPIIEQTIRISTGGRSYDAWVYVKRNYDDQGELFGRAINLECELQRPKHLSEVAYGMRVEGICELK